MQTILGIIIGFIVLTILVIVHEFGHFIAAIRNGIDVTEFGIGFPPRAAAWLVKRDKKTKRIKFEKLVKSEWDKQQKNLVFSLNWLPIGGFCSMRGENAVSKEKNSFGAASFWAKTKVLFAGVTFNFIFAVIIFTLLAWAGLPNFLPDQFTIKSDEKISTAKIFVKDVKKDSPAEKAGIKTNDRILAIDDKIINSPSDIINYNRDKSGQTIKITLERDGSNFTTRATLNEAGSEYKLGVASYQVGIASAKYSWSAPIVGVGTTVQLTAETFKGLGTLVYNLTSGIASQLSSNEATRKTGQDQINTVGNSVSGPIGIVGILFPSLASDLQFIALLAAIISVSLACMNILPIPALDGGRWLLIAIFKLRKKELTKEIEEKIVGRAFMFLIGLIIMISILDVIHIVSR